MYTNLFSALSRYATRQEENFLTEALVYVLNLLLEKTDAKGVEILQQICGDATASWFTDYGNISITTQNTIDEGMPDIVVTIAGDKVAFIEVKHDSSLGQDQLERYYAHLMSSPYVDKQLVLLTRSRNSIQETSLDQEQFNHVCWYELSGWLSEADLNDETSHFIVQQFLEFLREKEMSMEKVTWEYIEGVPVMANLLNMLGIAISEVDPELGVKKTMGWSWGGYYLEGEIFLGFRFANHLVISFENDTGNNPTFKRDLLLEKVHFFSLSAGEQLECLIEFIRKSYSEYLEK